MPFQRILCPVDFSDVSAGALHYAATLAPCAQSEVIAVYVNSFEAPPYFTQSLLGELERQFRDAFQQAERSLQSFVESTLGDEAAGVRTRVVEALPADGIHQLTAEAQADLVVMGTHGRTGFNRWMLGSVTERVLRETEVPVLTVRSAVRAPVPIRHVLCPVNNTQVARHALEVAANLAMCFDATITALHVQEPHGGNPISDLCAWIPAEERKHCNIRELVRKGEAAQEIIALASGMSCDLVVIGAEDRRFFDTSVLGTTTVRTVRHAPCPVLTVVGPGQ